MPYTLEWLSDGIYKKFSGYITAEEFMNSIADLQGDSRFDDMRYSINDFLGVEGYNITESDVRKFAAFGKGAMQHNPNIKIAIISTDIRVKSLVELYATPPLISFPLAIFETVEDARCWAKSV